MYISAETLNEAFKKSLFLLDNAGMMTHPRGTTCKEIMGLRMTVKNPRARIITEPARKLSLAYAVGEFLYYMSGSNSLAHLAYYSKRVKDFSDDNLTVESAYGHRIFGHDKGVGLNQWQYVIDKLTEDPDSRQAIMHINTPADMRRKTKDFPCTMSLQFFIREGYLHLINHMRSNDSVWGLGYDVYSFTMMQEMMAIQLGVDLGEYIHFAGSYHIYDRHFEMMKQILSGDNELPGVMPKMPKEFLDDLPKLIKYEEAIRLDNPYFNCLKTEYANNLLAVLLLHRESKVKLTTSNC